MPFWYNGSTGKLNNSRQKYFVHVGSSPALGAKYVIKNKNIRGQ